MSDYKTKLQRIQGNVKKQMSDYVPGGFGAPPPDGEYTFNMTAVLYETKKEPVRLGIKFDFTVNGGDFDGRTLSNRCIIEDNKVGLHIARDIVETLGYEWPEEDLGQLEDILYDITERCPQVLATIKSKQNGEFFNTNFRINEVFAQETGEAVPVETESEAEPEEVVEEVIEESSDENKTALLDFAASQGIDGFTDEDSLEDMVTALKESGIKFEGGTLAEEEVTLLTTLGLDSLINRKKAAVKKVVKK